MKTLELLEILKRIDEASFEIRKCEEIILAEYAILRTKQAEIENLYRRLTIEIIKDGKTDEL